MPIQILTTMIQYKHEIFDHNNISRYLLKPFVRSNLTILYIMPKDNRISSISGIEY